jgi:hypothetical protein
MNETCRIAVLVAALSLVPGIAGAAADGCDRPEPPVVPEGATATEDELAAAGSAVRVFISDSQTYLACLEEKEAAYGEEITDAQQALINAIYNSGVEAMEAAAAAYNGAVEAYRGRADG